MENENNFVCSLCFSPINDKITKEIDDTTKQIIDVIFVNKNFQCNKGQLLCQLCWKKLQDTFSFKCMCLNTENFLTPLVSAKTSLQMDLWELLKRHNGKDGLYIVDNQIVCRLCLQVITGPVNSLLAQTEFDMLQKYLSEVMIYNTSNPVGCDNCVKRLHELAGFILQCVNTQETGHKRLQAKGAERNICDRNLIVKLVHKDFCKLKQPNTVGIANMGHYNRSLHPVPLSSDSRRTTTPILQESPNATFKEMLDIEETILYDMDLQIVKPDDNKKQRNAKKHKSGRSGCKNAVEKHPDPAKTKTYTCQHCDYDTTYPNALKSHMLNHMRPSEIKWYICTECEYKTKYRNALKSHKLKHMRPSEIRMRKCKQCSYETKHRTALVLHMLKHAKPSEIPLYKCNQCEFQTKFKHALKPHEQRHRKVSS